MDTPEKVTIHVATAYTLLIDLGRGVETVKVGAGVQQVDKAIAEHWYTQQHLSHGGFGTAEYADAARAAADAEYHVAKAALEKYYGLERAALEAEEAAGRERSVPAWYRLGGVTFFEADDGKDDCEAEDEPAPVEPAPTPEASVEPLADPLQPAAEPPAGADSTPASAGDADVEGDAGDDAQKTDAGEDSLSASTDPAPEVAADPQPVLTPTGAEPEAEPTEAAAEPQPEPESTPDQADAYPHLSPAQEKALDRDGDEKPGGAPKGGNRRRGADQA